MDEEQAMRLRERKEVQAVLLGGVQMKADEKVSLELQDIAGELQKRINAVAGQEMLFSLVIYQPEEGSRMSYISNADRQSVHQALKSLIHGWENGMPDIAAHEVQ